MFLFVFEMKKLLTRLFLIFPLMILAQDGDGNSSQFILTPEFMVGTSAEANEMFPDRNPQTQLLLNFGWNHKGNPQEWAQRTNGPKTGISLGYTNFGNNREIGSSYTILPFIEFKALRSERLRIFTGMGLSYFDTKYDPVTNPFNLAITTDLVWSYRAFIYYKFIIGEKVDWRLGVGYYHHSNGHTRLPNQGFNSFLGSLSADLKLGKEVPDPEIEYESSKYGFISIRSGFGINALSVAAFNEKKPVYTLSGTYGRVYNNTYKLGLGFYYRFYQHYYDYISNNESLVQDGREFAEFKDSPWFNASVFGLHFSAEVLLNHVSIDVQIGLNITKPAYKIDWRINEGWDDTPRDIPDFWVLGEFDTTFRMKHLISSRMGMKYYLFGTKEFRKHNVFAAFHINSNLGQADFSELSLGYVYNFELGKN